MRRVNSIITAFIMLLFLVHMIWGGLLLAGIVKGGSKVFSVISMIMMILICLHVIISVKLTVDTMIASRKAGAFYFRENKLFLARRISGFALVFFIAVHVLIFNGSNEGGVYRLNPFGIAALISQILMVVCLVLHIVLNVRPLKIAFGFSDKRKESYDFAVVMAILLLIAAAAFLIYYLRWQA
ncbi:MAG: hypothetical protein IKR00_00290 [Lachnospiraceae bacterium]|nr:hypothetical protein [Lachnospiraceae bacterium]